MARFDETVNIQPQTFSTGAAQGMMSLAEKLDRFSQQTAAFAEKKIVEKASQEGMAAGVQSQAAGKPMELKEEGFIGGVRTKAYNKALQASYISGVVNDATVELSRIQAENNSNLIGYNDSAEAFSAGIMQSIDPAAKSIVAMKLDTMISAGRAAVQANEVKKNMEAADAVLKQSVQDESALAITYASQGLLDESAQSTLNAFAAFDERVDTMNLPEDRSNQLKTKFKEDLLKQTSVENIRFNFRNTYESDVGKAVDILQSSIDKPLKGFTKDEHSSLITAMKSDLSQFLQIENIKERETAEKTKAAQESAFVDLYMGVMNGSTDSADIMLAAQQRQIDGDQFSKLSTVFNTRGQGVDDYGLINDINSLMATNPAIAKRMIESNTGSRLTEKTASSLFSQVLDAETDESPLKTSRAIRFKSFLDNSVKVVGFLGQVDFDSQKRLAQLTVTYQERVLAGEDPAIVARDLIDVNSVITAPEPRFGSKDDLGESLRLLNEAAENGTIDEDTYNLEYQNIEFLRSQKSNIEGFEQALKEALKEQ